MRSVFYTLSALLLLVFVASLVSIRHNLVQAEEESVRELHEQERIARVKEDVMSGLLEVMGTSVNITRGDSGVTMEWWFNATLNSTNPSDRHLYRLLGNLQSYDQLSRLYCEDELSFDSANLELFQVMQYLTNNSRSFQYGVDPYGMAVTWNFNPGLQDENLTINRAGSSGDVVRVWVTGPAPNYRTATCCSDQELEFGAGNVTVKFSPQLSLRFDKIDPTQAGVVRVGIKMHLPATSELIRVRLRGASLSLRDRNTVLETPDLITG